MDQKLKEYAEMIYRSLKEQEINVQITPIVFVGGGASVMKHYIGNQIPNVDYKLDVKANAKGYETLMRIAMRNVRR